MVAVLLRDPGVAAIVGGNVYALLASSESQLSYPCVSYTLVGGSVALTTRNQGNVHQRVELNALAFTYAVAAQLRAAIITALSDWKEVLPDGTDVTGTYLVNPGIDFAAEDRIFRCLVEFYVDYNLPTPQ